jgi:hypothetical protein
VPAEGARARSRLSVLPLFSRLTAIGRRAGDSVLKLPSGRRRMPGINAAPEQVDMASQSRAFSYSFTLATAVLLAACGGSGGDGNSSSSSGGGGGTVTPAPVAVVTGLATVAQVGNVKLSWNATPGAASYKVLRCAVPATGPVTDLCVNSEAATCTPVATVAANAHTDVPAAPLGHCYRVQACSDAAGTNCGTLNADAQHGNARAGSLPVVFIDHSPPRTYSGQQTILHGYARNLTGAVTYQWKQITGAAVTPCPGTTDTTQDFCFIAPTVATRQRFDFELSAFDNGVFAAKSKVAANVEPAGQLILATQDTRVVQPGQTVSLHAQGAGGSGYTWVQTGPVSPSTGTIPPALLVTLTGAGTANPSFVAPAGIDQNQLRFQVTYTGPGGQTTTEAYAIGGQAAASAATGQPKQTKQSGLLPPPGAASLVAPPLARQPLTLVAPPLAQAASNTPASLTMTAAFGNTASPYTWSWVQKGGISVSSTLQGASTSLVKFTAPTVTAPQDLIFEVTVSDGTTTRVGQAVVRVNPAPPFIPPAPGIAPPLAVNTPLRLANIPTPLGNVAPNMVVRFSTPLKNPQVVQVAGYACPNLQVVARADGSGSDITCTAPRLPTDTATLRFQVKGTNSVGVAATEYQDVQVSEPAPVPAASAPAMVVPPPAPTNPEPLHVVNCGQQQATGGQSDDVILGVCASGGSGSYTYAWAFKGAQPSGVGADSIALRDATTKNARFTAPAVTATKVTLAFTVTVTDANNPAASITQNIAQNLYNVGGTADPGAVAQTVTVAPGHAVSLHLPAPFGGTPPYTYRLDSVVDSNGVTVGGLTQGTGPGCPGLTCSNWQFTPPAPPAGTTVTYTATYTTTDAVGTQQTDKTQVAVKPPPPPQGVAANPAAPTPEPAPVLPPAVASEPALVASITAADPAATAGSMTIQGNYTGKAHASNTMSYINWTLTCEAVLPDRNATAPDTGTPVSPGTICPVTTARLLAPDASGAAVTLGKLPYVAPQAIGASSAEAGTPRKTMTVQVTVVEQGTLSDGTTPLTRLAKASKTITVVAPLIGSQCYVCGDYDVDPRVECQRDEILTRKEQTCSNSKPYCMNDIFQAVGEMPKLYKRCVDEAEAYDLWYMQSSDKTACYEYDVSTFRDELVCHIACYGDHCNENPVPPQGTLYQP